MRELQEKDLMETVLTRETAAEGAFLRMEHWTVELPNGRQAGRDVLVHPGGAAVVAVDDEGRICLVRQCRVAFGRLMWEIPAGKLDAGGEDPELAAHRELSEETGYTCGKMVKLGAWCPTPGCCTERLHAYLATELVPGDTHPDEDEFVQTRFFPMEEELDMIASGEIEDMKTVAAVLAAQRYLK